MKATFSWPASVTVLGPKDFCTRSVSVPNRRTAAAVLVTRVGGTANPHAAAVLSCTGLYVASAARLGWLTQRTPGSAASTPPSPRRASRWA
ncbi:MAG: hypothetical protein ACR2GH_01780 [Pseudonocardia sp.]